MSFDYWTLLCRGRKRIVSLTLIFILLLNAFFYFGIELYNVKKYKREPWFKSLRFGENSYVDASGMRVVVGHYVGGTSGKNLSEDFIHTNRYAPVPGAGEMGRPVTMSQRELIPAREIFSLHSYNILIGDQISINRTLPDVRSTSCKKVTYNTENLPTASVIIVFHNEAWSTLMRTAMSVLMRSPEQLLKQIILVDDASDRRYLGQELDDAVSKFDKIQILRNKTRKGLVGARLTGARAATGDVLVFLDAHCEVTQGWLEPLLDRAGADDVFVCPHIDIISPDNLGYTKSVSAHWGAFSWRLHFRWIVPSSDIIKQMDETPSKPYPTPAMAGGLFAVRKSLFWRLGGYDEGMIIWGGENLEMSWRAWQCGARVEISPCSRVGHIFRQSSPYKYPGGVAKVMSANLARAAAVWMDEWANFYFNFNFQEGAEQRHKVADRVALRKSLNCKSFKWYLNHVWPEHFFPAEERWFGRIRSDLGACLGLANSNGMAEPAVGIACGHEMDLSSLVVYTPAGKIMTDEDYCLERGNGRVVWKHCTATDKQIWTQNGPRLLNDNLCLTLVVAEKQVNGVDAALNVKKCLNEFRGQIWHLERVPWR